MISEEQAEALIREFYRCQNEADWDGLDHCVTDDYYFYDAGFQLELKGKKALIESCINARNGVFEGRTFGFESIWATTETGFVVRKNWRGVLRHDAFGSPKGTEIKMRATTLITLRDGLICEYLDYACYDFPALNLSGSAREMFVEGHN